MIQERLRRNPVVLFPAETFFVVEPLGNRNHPHGKDLVDMSGGCWVTDYWGNQ